MTWYLMAAAVGLARLVWAPADSTLLALNVVLLIGGTIHVLTSDLMTPRKGDDDTDSIRSGVAGIRAAQPEDQQRRAA